MSYLNQFVICEDDQFECSGVFKIDTDLNVNQVQHSIEKYSDDCDKNDGNCVLKLFPKINNHVLDDEIEETNSTIAHLILASTVLSFKRFDKLSAEPVVAGFLNLLRDFVRVTSSTTNPEIGKRRKIEFKIKLGFLTCIQRNEVKCITKKESQNIFKMYRNGREKDVRSGLIIKKSCGDELVNFYQRMKYKIELPIYRSMKDAFRSNGVALFHFKLLPDEKIALSICYRKTFILKDDETIHMMEPDKFGKQNYQIKTIDYDYENQQITRPQESGKLSIQRYPLSDLPQNK